MTDATSTEDPINRLLSLAASGPAARVRVTRAWLCALARAVEDMQSETASVRADNVALRELVQRRDDNRDRGAT